jgi:hypothetical protein
LPDSIYRCEKFYFEIKTNHRNSIIFPTVKDYYNEVFRWVASFFIVRWYQFCPILKAVAVAVAGAVAVAVVGAVAVVVTGVVALSVIKRSDNR